MTKEEKRDRRQARHELLRLAEQTLPIAVKLTATPAQCRAAARGGVDRFLKRLQ